MVDGDLVAAVLGQVGSFVQNFLRLQHVAGHSLDHLVHDVSQDLPNLRATDSRWDPGTCSCCLQWKNILQFLPWGGCWSPSPMLVKPLSHWRPSSSSWGWPEARQGWASDPGLWRVAGSAGEKVGYLPWGYPGTPPPSCEPSTATGNKVRQAQTDLMPLIYRWNKSSGHACYCSLLWFITSVCSWSHFSWFKVWACPF